MNFTREPIILSVLTPKEGSKLVVRKSKGGSSAEEDYFVDAIEIVSFEGSVFFRSTERPKSFLVPVSDYEILELKETKIVLKNVSIDKNIKIPSKHSVQPRKEGPVDNKKQNRRRRPRTEGAVPQPPIGKEVKKEANVTEGVPQPSLKKLIPPPHTLIKEKLARLKSEEFFEKNILPSTETGTEATEAKVEKPVKEEKLKEKVEDKKPEKEIKENKASKENTEKPSEKENLSSKEKEKGVDS